MTEELFHNNIVIFCIFKVNTPYILLDAFIYHSGDTIILKSKCHHVNAFLNVFVLLLDEDIHCIGFHSYLFFKFYQQGPFVIEKNISDTLSEENCSSQRIVKEINYYVGCRMVLIQKTANLLRTIFAVTQFV